MLSRASASASQRYQNIHDWACGVDNFDVFMFLSTVFSDYHSFGLPLELEPLKGSFVHFQYITLLESAYIVESDNRHEVLLP